MKTEYLLGIDVGTTGTQTLLFSTDGQLAGQAYCGYDLYTPEVGYSEQNPQMPGSFWPVVHRKVRSGYRWWRILQDFRCGYRRWRILPA